MADYKISIGAELRTNEIDSTLKSYDNNKVITVNSKLDKTGLDRGINGYTPPKVIEVKSKLLSKGITDVINKYKNEKKIKILSDLDVSGIDAKIDAFNNAKKIIKVQAKFTREGQISNLIAKYNAQANKPQIEFDAKLKEDAIEKAIWRYAPTTPVPVDLKITPDFTGFDEKITNHKVKGSIEVKPVVLFSEIKEQINKFNGSSAVNGTLNTVTLKAKLIDTGIKDAIEQYKSQKKIPVGLEIKDDLTELEGDIAAKLKKYVEKPPEIPVKLKPATKGFAAAITKTPVPIQAELAQNALTNINAEIGTYTPTSKMPVQIKLSQKDANDINKQIGQLKAFATEKLPVDIELDDASVNTAISSTHPTAMLGVKVDVDFEGVDSQIKAHVPNAQIKVGIDLNEEDIAKENTGRKINTPIEISVKLDKDSINEAIKTATPQAKLKVPVKLDFASHKDKDGKEIQKGISKQIKEYQTKTKVKVGVQLDTIDVEQQIGSISTNTPVMLDVKIDPASIQNINREIDRIEQQLQNLSNIAINIGGNNGAGGGNSGGNGSGSQRRAGNLISNATKRAISNISSKEIEEFFEVSDIDSTVFENEMNNLVRKWTNNKGNVVDIQIETNTRFDKEEQQNIEELSKAHVTYKNAANESIKKTLEWKQIGVDDDGKTAIMGWVEGHATYRSSIEKTKAKTDAFAKQQKRTVAELTNQANQLNRAAIDKNDRRPIKDQGHLKQLSDKYTEITNAITRMGQASRDTFEDERNNVKRLISEYKSMRSEFRNAENVTNKESDYKSGKSAAEQELAKFKTEAQKYSQLSGTIGKLDTDIVNVDSVSSLKDFNNQLKVAKAELAKVKAEVNAAKLDKKLKIDVSGLTGKIDDLKKANPEIVNFTTKIDNADVSITDLLNDLAQVKTKADFDIVSYKFKAFEEAARNAGVALNDVVVKASSINQIKGKLSDQGVKGFTQEIRTAHEEVNKFGGSSETLTAALNKVDAAFEKVKTADEASDMKALVAANKEYEDSLERLYSLLALLKQAQDAAFKANMLDLNKTQALSELDGLFESGSQAAKEFGERLEILKKQINDCTDDNAWAELQKKKEILKSDVKGSGLRTKTLSSSIKEQFQKYGQYISVASVFMYATQAARSMFEQVKLIDSAMTELKKVTDETDATYNEFLSNAAKRSKELGTTIDGLIGSTADFARLGYGFEDSQKLAEVANIYAVVGDEIESIEDATQSLVSTLAAFKDEMNGMSDGDFAMSIVDKMNEVSNNFAISSGGIGEALKRSASSMAAANNSLDETIAMITAANTVAQNPEKVGKGYAD